MTPEQQRQLRDRLASEPGPGQPNP
jgi:hypothetical protein